MSSGDGQCSTSACVEREGKEKRRERERKPCAGMPPCVVAVGGEPW
jgi:hypothetical protein